MTTAAAPTNTLTITLRDEAPAEEIRDALRQLADEYPVTATSFGGTGHGILWSSHGWNCGTVRVEATK